jgi:hypothetical protein
MARSVHSWFREADMPGKKKAADVGKLVDAQARGKNVKSVKKDTKRSTGSELDARENKAYNMAKLVN